MKIFVNRLFRTYLNLIILLTFKLWHVVVGRFLRLRLTSHSWRVIKRTRQARKCVGGIYLHSIKWRLPLFSFRKN